MEILDIVHQPIHCGDTVAVVDSNRLVIGIVIKRVPSGMHVIFTSATFGIYNRFVALHKHSSIVDELVSQQTLVVPSGLYKDREDVIKNSFSYNRAIKAIHPKTQF